MQSEQSEKLGLSLVKARDKISQMSEPLGEKLWGVGTWRERMNGPCTEAQLRTDGGRGLKRKEEYRRKDKF
jgi:hypothetical protein